MGKGYFVMILKVAWNEASIIDRIAEVNLYLDQILFEKNTNIARVGVVDFLLLIDLLQVIFPLL